MTPLQSWLVAWAFPVLPRHLQHWLAARWARQTYLAFEREFAELQAAGFGGPEAELAKAALNEFSWAKHGRPPPRPR